MSPPGAPFSRPGSAGFPARPPSRTHSPLAGPGVNPATAPPYHLPLPVPTHPHPGYHFYQGAPPPVPTFMDLERHFTDLEREKRQLQELLDRTDRMMAGLRRGMDEMRMHQPPPPPLPHAHQVSAGQQQQQQYHQPAQGHHQPSQGPSLPAPPTAEAVPLNRVERSASTQSNRESIWPVNPPESAKRD